MSVRRMLELMLPLAIACGDPVREDNLGESTTALDVTVPATELGIDDAVFQRVDSLSYPVLACPPDAPFVCRAESPLGWSCSNLACPPPEPELR